MKKNYFNKFVMTMTSKKKKISPTCRIKFSPMENAMLKYLIDTFGTSDWVLIASMMPGRNPKQCRDRFCNYLSEFRQIGPWTQEEDDLLLTLLQEYGSKWVEISRHIPERSENDVKNRWYKHLRKDYPEINELIIMRNSKNKKVDSKLESEKKPEKDLESKNVSDNVSDPFTKYSINNLLV